jgi:hypothetical protein
MASFAQGAGRRRAVWAPDRYHPHSPYKRQYATQPGPDCDGISLAVQLVGRPWENHGVLAAANLLAC